ncbi:MAG TPA: benzoyl-CoA reductase subunit C [Planctomycetes bacterium]|nr:benzoyl-CoA reductase subunit C [Planctomycetota bacterium]
MKNVDEIVERCEELYEDLEYGAVARWKEANPEGAAVGFLPTYIPREVLHAAGVLPVGILGAGDQLEIVKGDAFFQSYICHIPRSVVELGLSGKLDSLDGMIFPSTCDVIRNLSGIWKLQFPDKLSFYFDVPQNFDPEVGGAFYADTLRELLEAMCSLTGRDPKSVDLSASIHLYNENRRLIAKLKALRSEEPWRVPASELYLVLRAGMVLPIEEFSALIEDYLEAVAAREGHEVDNARVLLAGAFCEQPPLTLIRTLERSGCEVVDDDTMLVLRWLGDEVSEEGDPIEALAKAYIAYTGEASCKYVPDGEQKGIQLVRSVRKHCVEGVIFAAPSFCDPALLDRPMLQSALDAEGISYTAFNYAENTGQMQPIREQAGTFADTIKLWGGE